MVYYRSLIGIIIVINLVKNFPQISFSENIYKDMGNLVPSSKKSLKAFTWRNICEGLSMGINFSAIQLIPLSTYEVILNFKSIISVILSSIFLKEKLNFLDIFFCISSFFGMILVVKPNILFSSIQDEEIANINYLFGCCCGLTGCFLISIANILTRLYSNLNNF